MANLLDPNGRTIGHVDGPADRTHKCRQGCRLHDPCCMAYRITGWDHYGDCPYTTGGRS